MFVVLLPACLHVPEAPPPSTTEVATADTADPGPVATSGFGTCGDLTSSLVLPGDGYDTPTAALAWPDGGAVLAVRHDRNLTFGTDTRDPTTTTPLGESACALARLDERGAPRWVTSLEGTSQADLRALAPGPAGDLYVGGSGDSLSALADGPALGDRGESDAFVARLDPAGNVVWVVSVGSVENDATTSIVALPDGDLVAAGVLGGTATFGAGELGRVRVRTAPGAELTLWLARFSPAGTLRWVTTAGGATSTEVTGLGVAPDGGLLVSGSVYGSGATWFSDDLSVAPPQEGLGFVARYTTDGALRWVAEVGGAEVSGVAVGPDGEVLAVGSALGPVTFGRGEPGEQSFEAADLEGWAARFEGDGSLGWVARVRPGAESSVLMGGVTALGDEVVVVGRAAGRVSFGDTHLVALGRDGFVARLDRSGQWGCALVLRSLDSASQVWPLGVGPADDGLRVWGVLEGQGRLGDGGADVVDVAAEAFTDAFLVGLALR
jgi:hypothetical protein